MEGPVHVLGTLGDRLHVLARSVNVNTECWAQLQPPKTAIEELHFHVAVGRKRGKAASGNRTLSGVRVVEVAARAADPDTGFQAADAGAEVLPSRDADSIIDDKVIDGNQVVRNRCPVIEVGRIVPDSSRGVGDVCGVNKSAGIAGLFVEGQTTVPREDREESQKKKLRHWNRNSVVCGGDLTYRLRVFVYTTAPDLCVFTSTRLPNQNRTESRRK